MLEAKSQIEQMMDLHQSDQYEMERNNHNKNALKIRNDRMKVS